MKKSKNPVIVLRNTTTSIMSVLSKLVAPQLFRRKRQYLTSNPLLKRPKRNSRTKNVKMKLLPSGEKIVKESKKGKRRRKWMRKKLRSKTARMKTKG